jgi:integrase
MDILNICRIYEKEGKHETAKKVKTKCGQIFRYAVSLGLCERDVTQDLRGVLTTPETKHMAAIIDPDEFAKLLNDLDHYDGSVITQYALRIAPLVFVRPGELRHAKWADIDLKKVVGNTRHLKPRKTGVSHIVPLSTQVIQMLKELAK